MQSETPAERRPFIIVCGDYVKTGGQDVANLALADYLARQGREVHAVGYRFDPLLGARPTAHLHRVHKLANSYTMSAPVLTAAGLGHYLVRLRQKPHVVANGGNCPTPSVNWVHYVHAAFRPTSNLLRRRLVQAYARPVSRMTEKLALTTARVVIANSERTRRHLIELVGVPPDRITTVYYGTDPARFQRRTEQSRRDAAAALGWTLDRFRVVFIGALGDSRKGLDALYEAWRILCRDASWDGELVVVGFGAELEPWRARVREEGLTGRVSFLGFRSDVPQILAACDALISPTLYEAYGLGVHEALCVGLPALVSKEAGIAERYPASLQDLLIVNPKDAREIAEKLRHVRSAVTATSAAIADLGDKLRAWTWDDMAREIERICDLAD